MSGALTHSPADILSQLMVDLSLGTRPSSQSTWPVYISMEPSTPDSVITLQDTESVPQGRHMANGEVQEQFGVQVRVRAATHATAFAKARAIAVSLDTNVAYTGVAIDSSGYTIHNVSRKSGPLAIGKEPESRRDIFTINVVMAITQS